MKRQRAPESADTAQDSQKKVHKNPNGTENLAPGDHSFSISSSGSSSHSDTESDSPAALPEEKSSRMPEPGPVIDLPENDIPPKGISVNFPETLTSELYSYVALAEALASRTS